MKRIILLLAALAPLWASTMAAPSATNVAATNRVLMIEPSSMPIAGGRATLTIGALRRTNGIYWGNYELTVAPYFFKNEKGRLAINVSDESLARVTQGKGAVVTGTSTTSGYGGPARHIDATATPAGNDRGRLKLWFMAGDRKMVFEPAYNFGGNATDAVPAQTAEMNGATQSMHHVPVSHREALDAAEKRPRSP